MAVETLFVSNSSSSSRVAGSSPSSSWCVGTPKRKTVRAPPLYAFLTHSLSHTHRTAVCVCGPVVIIQSSSSSQLRGTRPSVREIDRERRDGSTGRRFSTPASQPAAATLKLKLPSRITANSSRKIKSQNCHRQQQQQCVECGVKCVLKAAKFMLKIDNH